MPTSGLEANPPNTHLVLTSDSADIDRLAQHLPCARCGYDLFNQPLNGKCPECNERVSQARAVGPDPKELTQDHFRELRDVACLLTLAHLLGPLQIAGAGMVSLQSSVSVVVFVLLVSVTQATRLAASVRAGAAPGARFVQTGLAVAAVALLSMPLAALFVLLIAAAMDWWSYRHLAEAARPLRAPPQTRNIRESALGVCLLRIICGTAGLAALLFDGLSGNHSETDALWDGLLMTMAVIALATFVSLAMIWIFHLITLSQVLWCIRQAARRLKPSWDATS